MPLNAGGGLVKREGFYLHGGVYVGSNGCIDVGGGREGNAQTKKLLKLIGESSFDKIALTVRR